MAKLTDRKRANIQAKWDTGQYTKTSLAKTYKVTEKVIREIVGKKKPTNSHIVDAHLMLEDFKNSEKTPNEINAINQAVSFRLKEQYSDDKKRVKVYDLTDKILDKVGSMLDKGKKQIVMKVKEYNTDGGNYESLDTVDIDLDASDLKNMQDTVDKASITNNTNLRHAPKIDITQQTAVQSTAPTTIQYIEDVQVRD